mmetsp:Transcript_14013/g.46409  ORF Transcript_14013/g.46409 Transcript_14013/m.46409 type:complete len:308 (-) Transcript_14013:250-1173(-)
MISSFTSCVYVRSPDLRVMMSHFSGVVTMTWVSSICCRERDTSPVSSRTFTPNGFKRLPRLPTISATSAFMGATYTILNSFKFKLPSSRRCNPSSCRIVSIATLVFPAPVGAHRSMFSGDNMAVSYTWLCTRFRLFIPENAGCAQLGSSAIGRSFSAAENAFGFSAGMCTSSYPFFALRYDPAGSSHRLLDMKCEPCANARASSSTIFLPEPAAPAPAASKTSAATSPRKRRASSRIFPSIALCRDRALERSPVRRSDCSTAAASGLVDICSMTTARSCSFCALASLVHQTTEALDFRSFLIRSNLS